MRRAEILILFSALIIRLIYFSYTDYNVRTHDVEGHIEYIQYFVDHLTIPHANQCWECHQPPLYYAFSASVVKAVQTVFSIPFHRSLQLISLLFSMAALGVATCIFQSVFTDKRSRLVALALFCFWPSNIVHSIRIGNDALIYLLHFLALYWLLAWQKSKSMRDLLITTTIAGIALSVKASAIIMVAVILVTVSFDVVKRELKGKALKNSILACTPLLLGFGLFYFFLALNHSVSIANTEGLPQALRVQNFFHNYISFDFKTYITAPFTNPWRDLEGRQYFWNYFLKTSLFGEFQFTQTYAGFLATILSVCLLLLIPIFIFGALLQRKNIIWQTNAILSLAALLSYRVLHPYSCNTDFRFILPILISLVIFFGSAHERFPAFTKIISFFFVATSLLFFLHIT